MISELDLDRVLELGLDLVGDRDLELDKDLELYGELGLKRRRMSLDDRPADLDWDRDRDRDRDGGTGPPKGPNVARR